MNKVKQYEDPLMDVLRFDAEDVEANRAGTLSARQIRTLKGERLRQVLWVAFGTLLYAGSLMFILLRSLLNSAGGLLLAGALIAGLGVAYLTYQRKIAPLSSDIQENKALAVDGRVDLSLKRQGSRIKYALAVGKMTFPISKDAFLSFKNRDPYCVYYAPHSKRILSVEWLRDDQPFVEDEMGVPPKRRQAY